MGEAKRRGTFEQRRERGIMRRAVYDAATLVKRLADYPRLTAEERRERCKQLAILMFKERMGVADDHGD